MNLISRIEEALGADDSKFGFVQNSPKMERVFLQHIPTVVIDVYPTTPVEPPRNYWGEPRMYMLGQLDKIHEQLLSIVMPLRQGAPYSIEGTEYMNSRNLLIPPSLLLLEKYGDHKTKEVRTVETDIVYNQGLADSYPENLKKLLRKPGVDTSAPICSEGQLNICVKLRTFPGKEIYEKQRDEPGMNYIISIEKVKELYP
jgi:hypothetical protein